ncbi:hypothetical protein [Paludisphaera rhizosphaerae]|uniref:hypothetical protein n=1 Tax=Paludisphaera rhizosphaerae TaxID=2711216 RepID=UPI0013EA6097|nr:hypothetical protein [Paludisphaera rhizosphaerae]
MPRIRFRLWYLAIAVGLAAMVAALIRNELDHDRNAVRDPACRSRALSLYCQLLVYVRSHGRPPPLVALDVEGTPAHSWRALVWAEGHPEFLVHYDFRLPWRSESNLGAATSAVSDFACENSQAVPFRYTNFVALVDGGLSSLDFVGAGTPDGEARIVLIEAPDSKIRWTEPRDVSPADIAKFSDVAEPGGYAVALSDGTVKRFTREEILQRWARAKRAAGATKNPSR